MARTPSSKGFISIFFLIVWLAGAAGGAVLGYLLDGVIDERLLGIVAAFLVVILLGILRQALGASFPSLFLAPKRATIPVAVWVSIAFATLVGGLAGHDLSQLADISSGAMIGSLSGTIAAISMASLMILYFREHPEEGVEF
jgi:hypothetical protein